MQVLMKEDTDTENDAKNQNADNISPLNEDDYFKSDEYRNFDDTNEYQEDYNQQFNDEVEKPIELSTEKSDEKHKIIPKTAANYDQINMQRSREESQGRQEKSQPKQRKHNFNTKFDNQSDSENMKASESNQIVEETPENQDQTNEYQESRFTPKETVRSSQQRKYKAWERNDYKSKINGDIYTFRTR